MNKQDHKGYFWPYIKKALWINFASNAAFFNLKTLCKRKNSEKYHIVLIACFLFYKNAHTILYLCLLTIP